MARDEPSGALPTPTICPPPEAFHAGCAELGLQLSEAEIARIGRFLALLLQTNQQFNLTAVRDPEAAWMRHGLDSLTLFPWLVDLPAGARLIDVGTGGGLPGMVLAIVCPDLAVTLLEATGKKARFCETAAATLGLNNLTVLNDRAETAGRNARHREQFDVVTARAVGPMRVMLEFTLPLARVGGVVLAMKGRQVEAELRDAGDALITLGGGEIDIVQPLPDSEPDAVVVAVSKQEHTPSEYPRRPGEPKQNPL